MNFYLNFNLNEDTDSINANYKNNISDIEINNITLDQI